jgi:hypothetical protein
MHSKQVASFLVLSLAIAGVACGGDDSSGTDGGVVVLDGTTPMCTDPGATGSTRFYVINVLDIPAESPPGTVWGFNLDGITTPMTEMEDPTAFAAGCGQPDKISPAPDNITGVDNQLSPILSTLGSSLDISGTIAENLRDGDLLLLAEIEGVDDATTDDCVRLNLYLGKRVLADPAATCADAAECTAPTCGSGQTAAAFCEAGACEDGPCVDGSEVIVGGQTFDINTMSFGPGGAPLITAVGTIISGRLNVGPIDITVPIPIMDMTLNLMIQQAQVRATLSGDTLTLGVIGGKLDVMQIIETIAAIPDLADFRTIIETTLMNQADLDPDGTGTCQSVSVGLVFDAVDAVEGATR